MRVLMIVIMLVIVRIRDFGLLIRSLICVCHLSRGQIHAFQETSVSAAPPAMRYERGYASLLLYEASVERVKPRAVRHSGPKARARSKPSPEPPSNALYRCPASVELSENICSRMCHCIDCPGCSTTIPVSSSLAHWCPIGSS